MAMMPRYALLMSPAADTVEDARLRWRDNMVVDNMTGARYISGATARVSTRYEIIR